MKSVILCSILIATVTSFIMPSSTNIKKKFMNSEQRRILDGLSFSSVPHHRLTAQQRSISVPSSVEDYEQKWIDEREFHVQNSDGLCILHDDSAVSDCHKFTFDNLEEILKAELLLDFRSETTEEDVYVEVKELSDWALESWQISKIFLKSWKGGKVRIPISDHVKLWLSESGGDTHTVLLEINSRLKSSGNRIHTLRKPPVLGIAYMRKTERLPRQQSSCHLESPCCMQSFYVNFTEIGWNEWIIAPEGYWANYCMGHCSDINDHHEKVTGDLLRVAQSNNSNFFVPPKSCAPTHYDSLKIVFAAGPNEIRTSVLHGMKVLQCGCNSRQL